MARVLFSAAGPGAFEPIVWSDQLFDFTFRPTSDAKALAEVPSPQALLTSPIDPSTYDLEAGSIGGKTRDGRNVTVWFDEQDDGKKCRVTVLIGRAGDPDLSLKFLDHLANRLAAPSSHAQTRVAPPSG